MRRLIISNTHYQTIVAIQLKLSLFKFDDVVLLISDHSRESAYVVKRLNKLGLFEEVHYLCSRKILYNYSFWQKIRDFYDLSFRNTGRYTFYLDEVKNKRFDEIVFYNFGPDIHGLYCLLSEYNKNICISLFEEGLLSYGASEKTSWRLHLTSLIRKIRGKKNIYDAKGCFYSFFPSLYEGGFYPVKIPFIGSSGHSVNCIKSAFGMEECNLTYDKKYIFFSSAYDFEGGSPIGEFELAKKEYLIESVLSARYQYIPPP